jgi:hypothetical protein
MDRSCLDFPNDLTRAELNTPFTYLRKGRSIELLDEIILRPVRAVPDEMPVFKADSQLAKSALHE